MKDMRRNKNYPRKDASIGATLITILSIFLSFSTINWHAGGGWGSIAVIFWSPLFLFLIWWVSFFTFLIISNTRFTKIVVLIVFVILMSAYASDIASTLKSKRSLAKRAVLSPLLGSTVSAGDVLDLRYQQKKLASIEGITFKLSPGLSFDVNIPLDTRLRDEEEVIMVVGQPLSSASSDCPECTWTASTTIPLSWKGSHFLYCADIHWVDARDRFSIVGDYATPICGNVFVR